MKQLFYPGSYTIEATTRYGRQTGPFTLKTIGRVQSSCVTPIATGQTISGTWTDSCLSTYRTGRYARYFSFSLAVPRQVQIDLGSTDDAYLYLIWGLEPTGVVAASDDDGGPGIWDARIIRNLPAGVYLIEATTYFPNRSGNFLLRLQAR